ncbi:DUF3054 domain-containing protein [Frigoribacterium salinisoli]
MRTRGVPLAVDLAAVLLFVVVGRRSHDEGQALLGLLTTLWPFALGALAGHGLLLALRRRASAPTSGLVVWPVTVGIGMLLRVASDQGVQASFVVVATVVLGVLLLLGWRSVAHVVRRRRRSR